MPANSAGPIRLKMGVRKLRHETRQSLDRSHGLPTAVDDRDDALAKTRGHRSDARPRKRQQPATGQTFVAIPAFRATLGVSSIVTHRDPRRCCTRLKQFVDRRQRAFSAIDAARQRGPEVTIRMLWYRRCRADVVPGNETTRGDVGDCVRHELFTARGTSAAISRCRPQGCLVTMPYSSRW